MECLVKDVKIYYEVYGEGIPVLMIHGWGPDHRLMKGCMEPVFKNMGTKWKRIYFDLPGMGKTKGEPWIDSSDKILNLVFGFIDAVIPNRHFVLAGESYGGYIARGIISKRPSAVDGLLLICPVVIEDTAEGNGARFQVLEKDDAFLNSLSEEDRKEFENDGINVIRNKRVWERYKIEVLPGLKSTDNYFLQNLGKHFTFSFDVDTLERPYLKPTLMLTGRQDSIVGYDGLWKIIELYPRASFILLDKAGHALQIEQDVLFTESVKEWLNRVAAEPDFSISR
jgi:pimeloyl-ACP methyl ester carboxylesterase